MLPTVAYIGGPAEIAYLAQSEAIYRVVLGRMPVVVPRAGFTILDAASQSRLLERIWEPKVMVRGRIAMVWAEYDFYANGKFGHCGVDSFLMLKTAGGWKATAISYTAETEGCVASPLGPPKE